MKRDLKKGGLDWDAKIIVAGIYVIILEDKLNSLFHNDQTVAVTLILMGWVFCLSWLKMTINVSINLSSTTV